MKAEIIQRKWLLEWFDERMCYHMPSLTLAGNGNLLAVWNGGFMQWNGDPMGRDAQDWVSILEPGASAWSNPEAIGGDIRYGCHDPIFVKNAAGEIILLYAKFLDSVCAITAHGATAETRSGGEKQPTVEEAGPPALPPS